MAYRIAVIGGDGTGPEVIAEGLKVLKAVAQIIRSSICPWPPLVSGGVAQGRLTAIF